MSSLAQSYLEVLQLLVNSSSSKALQTVINRGERKVEVTT